MKIRLLHLIMRCLAAARCGQIYSIDAMKDVEPWILLLSGPRQGKQSMTMKMIQGGMDGKDMIT